MSRKAFGSVIVLATICLSGAAALAEVHPHGLFSDNMVLQQGAPISVWGTAKPGEKVTVKLAQKEASATTDDKGKWSVKLEAMKPGEPLTMTIVGENTITFNNVVIGEVWIASGQSNMQFAVKQAGHSAEEIAAANYPNLRLFSVPRVVASKPQDDVAGKWEICTPETVGDFSAVGYFFGRDLQKALNVPVGIIHASWGGTPAEAWASMRVLEGDPTFKPILDRWAQAIANYRKALDAQVKDLQKWVADSDAADAAGKPIATPKIQLPPDPRLNPHRPSVLYNAMIHPLLPYAVKGAIWYQGESNAGEAFVYRKLFPAMIRNWRTDWKLGDFPFLFVQLAPFRKTVDQPGESDWAELREAQLLTMLTVPNTAMAVITDVGEENNIHPKAKQPVGARLALAARALGYGEKIEYSGPIYKAMKREGNKIVISFDHLGGGLVAKDGPLKGFAIAGADKKFVNATAEIVGDTVVVSSPEVAQPVAVRYGWANYPVVNLWNKAGLPASPFRTDDFPMVTGPK
jgi:sialate O-acetylesterase